MRNKGITLVSLVITIVVLIILASLVIYFGLGQNGILERSKQARELTNKQAATEKINLKITTAQINNYSEKQEDITLKELSQVLKEDDEIQYVTETSKIARAEYDVPSENPTSIYTKLNEYPYEFEINTSLQIVKIDGKQVSNNSSSNTGGNIGGSVGESNIIEDIELIVSFNNGEYIELTCNAKTVDNSEISGYAFLLNGEVKKYCKENVVNIDGLTLNTNYTVEAIAMDKTGKTKRTNNIEVKTENKVYLYKAGNECTYLTGGWKHTGYDVYNWGTITKNEDNIYIYAPNASRIFCGTTKIIDLSKYSKLYIEGDGNQQLYMINTKSYFNDSSGTEDLSYKSKEEVNISDYNSQYYLHFTNANGCYQTIKNVWLEY